MTQNPEENSEDFELDGFVDPADAYNLGISSVDFYLGALSRLGPSNKKIALKITTAFVRELIKANQFEVTVDFHDDNDNDSPPSEEAGSL